MFLICPLRPQESALNRKKVQIANEKSCFVSIKKFNFININKVPISKTSVSDPIKSS